MIKPFATIGIDDHNGWANLVIVAVLDGMFEVREVRKVALLDAGLPKQPYHNETVFLQEIEAENLIAKVVGSAVLCTHTVLHEILTDFDEFNFESIAVRNSPLAALPGSVTEAHANRSTMFSADGMIYHHAFSTSVESLGLCLMRFDRDTVVADAAVAAGLEIEAMQELLAKPGKNLGPPWRKEHRLAFAGAVLALSHE